MRWRGRELLDIFESEFRDRKVEYYVCAQNVGVYREGRRLDWTVLISCLLERRDRKRCCCRQWQNRPDEPCC
jgi:hypothetical protein